MRLLGAKRLSNLTDATTSPERQDEQITGYAALHRHTLTAITEDLDVSGAMSPFDRPGLGPWLNDPAKIALWDGLVVSKFDRLGRRQRDYLDLIDWCQVHGKSLVCVAESLDFSTAMGRAMASMLAVFAQLEREVDSERRKEAKARLDQLARWGGGTLPYGYAKRKLSGGGWELIPDPDTAAIVHEMAARVIAGQSARSICLDLTARGVPTSTGKSLWRVKSLTVILRSPVLTGHVLANGEIVRDADGLAVRREAVLSDAEWAAVQTALDAARQDHNTGRSDAAPLLKVGFCACGYQLVRESSTVKGRVYAYYKCSNREQADGCKVKRIRAGVLEALIEDTLLGRFGDVPMQDEKITPAEDHAADLAAVDEAITSLETAFVGSGMSADRYASTMARLEGKRADLAALPTAPESTEWIPTGETFRQHWESLDQAGRRAFMIRAEVKAFVTEGPKERPEDDGSFPAIWEAGPDTKETDPERGTSLAWSPGFWVTIRRPYLTRMKRLASRATK